MPKLVCRSNIGEAMGRNLPRLSLHRLSGHLLGAPVMRWQGFRDQAGPCFFAT